MPHYPESTSAVLGLQFSSLVKNQSFLTKFILSIWRILDFWTSFGEKIQCINYIAFFARKALFQGSWPTFLNQLPVFVQSERERLGRNVLLEHNHKRNQKMGFACKLQRLVFQKLPFSVSSGQLLSCICVYLLFWLSDSFGIKCVYVCQ